MVLGVSVVRGRSSLEKLTGIVSFVQTVDVLFMIVGVC